MPCLRMTARLAPHLKYTLVHGHARPRLSCGPSRSLRTHVLPYPIPCTAIPCRVASTVSRTFWGSPNLCEGQQKVRRAVGAHVGRSSATRANCTYRATLFLIPTFFGPICRPSWNRMVPHIKDAGSCVHHAGRRTGCHAGQVDAPCSPLPRSTTGAGKAA